MRPFLLLGFTIFNWLHRLGGPGLILLGLADNSLVPLPGSQDVFVIILSSARHNWWPYYALMATIGAVAGGYVTYRLAEKGGEETLEKKVGKQRAEKVYKRFEKHGFSTVVIGAILPPPFPIVPFLMAAGVLQYPRKKFLAALSLGRGARYCAVGYIGRTYGNAIIGFFGQYKDPILYALIGLGVLGGIAALLYFKYYRPKRRREEQAAGEPVEELPIPGRGNQKLRGNQKREEESEAGEPEENESTQRRSA